jgi:hypothetical protein
MRVYVTSTSASEDFHFDNISIFDAIRLSDPDIRCDLKNSFWRVTELSVVCVRPEDESLPAKYPAGGHAHRDSPAIFFLSQAECYRLALERLRR